jgi:hypothetical protein
MVQQPVSPEVGHAVPAVPPPEVHDIISADTSDAGTDTSVHVIEVALLHETLLVPVVPPLPEPLEPPLELPLELPLPPPEPDPLHCDAQFMVSHVSTACPAD